MSTGLTASGTVFAAPAWACTNIHENVEATDYQFFGAYGNKGYIYVNEKSTLANLNGGVGRTFAVFNEQGTENVEFGWSDDLTLGGKTYTTPVPTSDYMVGGMTQPATALTSYTLSYDTDTWFRIDNVGGVGIFRYVIDSGSSPIGYSPTMSFNVGFPLTNSEHYNTCDSLYTHQYDLAEDVTGTSSPTWQPYTTLTCLANTASDWYLHLNSETDLAVTGNSSGNYGNGCVQH